MENNQLTAAEARAHMAQGPQYRVSTGDNCKYQLCGNLLFVKCNTNWYRADEDVFEHSAPFTPYVKGSKRELRERAERAEDSMRLQTEYIESLLQNIKAQHKDVINWRQWHGEWKERAERAEAQLATIATERDALIERIKHLSSAHTALLVANLPPAPDTKKFIERLQVAQKATREHNCPLCAEEAMEETP